MPFRIALSGLNGAQADLKTTANNIANANTTGFKQSRAEFVDIFAIGYGGVSSTAIGGGTRLASVAQQFSQGNVDFTNNNLDLAINGQGFFIMDNNGSRMLTRAGAFRVDRDGNVVNSSNHKLQVFPATVTPTGTVFDTGRLTSLQLSTSVGSPKATDLISSDLNLDASAIVPAAAFNIANPQPDQYNSSTSMTVYDSLGSAHTATQYFRKTAANSWNTYLYVDNTLVTTGGGASNFGSMTFSPTGALLTPVGGQIPFDPYVPTTGASNISLTLSFAKATQYGSPFAVNSLSQNGYSPGRLSGIDIDAKGVVSARYTNGQSTTMGKVALGNVQNPQSLSPQGDTEWGQTYAAGDLLLGEAGTGSFGLMQSGALEASNVDVAASLVNLITAQRNFQANAQVITTANQVTQTIIQMR
ncbi:MAG: flagellar hook protein FlgE [Gammaproteobacteria bacterium]|nr:flagellar hook protein FlgE [Gammaproteobacteria bacterium]